jgi:alcohol dehydrogenase, propanol-preferring
MWSEKRALSRCSVKISISPKRLAFVVQVLQCIEYANLKYVLTI